MSGIDRQEVTYYWARHSDLAREAGCEPNTIQLPLSDEHLFREFARVCLHLSKIPTRPELDIAARELRTATSTARSRHGRYREFVRRFREWLNKLEDEGLRPIIGFPGWEVQSNAARRSKTQGSIAPPAIRPWLPISLQFLDVMSRGELPPYEDPTVDPNLLFERRCVDAFQCLGFEVNRLGQGKGRQPDCIALAPREHFAVLVDAKARADGYTVGTEDRKFLEYANTCSEQLVRDGFERLYLVVVSSGFRDTDPAKLAGYFSAAPIRGVALITARAMMRLVEESIQSRNRFQLGDFETLINKSKLISS